MINDFLFSFLNPVFGENKDVTETINEIAIKAADYLKGKDGYLYKLVHIKGENHGYYWSPLSKKMILVPRRAEFYLLPLEKDEKDRYFLFLPHFLTTGVVICVPFDEIEYLGFN
jgi:hypothetical protein